MLIIDSALPAAESVRDEALRAHFIDWEGHDGEVYRRVCLCEVPGLRDLIEATFGPVEFFGMGYRLNFGGELPNAAIHSDLGWGTHAAVVYLCEGEGGTAFWRHKATGATRIQQGDHALLAQVSPDWDDASKWEQVALAPLKFNRAVFYEGERFHSRWPFAAFGDSPETGRLIAVAFFTPKDGK